MAKRIVVFGLFISAFLLYCSARDPHDAVAETAYNSVEKSTSEVLKFKKVSYIDQTGTGLEAFSLLMPADWQFTGGITWMLDVPMMPARAAFRASDP
ncbi:MAG: hypothetical protein KDD06_14215, partial [Phaeodactylibacter sp.]|nr:hypothetical protein [Phaeodactylibacter sp.]